MFDMFKIMCALAIFLAWSPASFAQDLPEAEKIHDFQLDLSSIAQMTNSYVLEPLQSEGVCSLQICESEPSLHLLGFMSNVELFDFDVLSIITNENISYGINSSFYLGSYVEPSETVNYALGLNMSLSF